MSTHPFTMTKIAPRPWLAVALGLGLTLGGCGGGSDGGDGNPDGGSAGPATSPNGLPIDDAGMPGPAPTPGSAVLFQRDFQGFTAWPHFDLISEVAIGDGAIHHSGKRTVYINKMPTSGATSFDTGTIIVKTMQSGEVFARVKRGGDYNKNGNLGWEWFELKDVDGVWAIVWRGITPPAGFCYGGIVGGACNDCHRAFARNDFVATAALDLSKL
jgi:hypothetical protein